MSSRACQDKKRMLLSMLSRFFDQNVANMSSKEILAFEEVFLLLKKEISKKAAAESGDANENENSDWWYDEYH